MSILANWGSELLVIALSLTGAVVVWFGGARNEKRKEKARRDAAYKETRKRMDEYARDNDDISVPDRLRKHSE